MYVKAVVSSASTPLLVHVVGTDLDVFVLFCCCCCCCRRHGSRFDDVLVGVPAEAAAGQGLLSALHQVDQPREGRLQAGRLQSRFAVMGPAQEQARHELRDHGPRPEVRHPVHAHFAFYRVLPSFRVVCRVLPAFFSLFIPFHLILLAFTGFYRVLPGFTEFYRVLFTVDSLFI